MISNSRTKILPNKALRSVVDGLINLAKTLISDDSLGTERTQLATIAMIIASLNSTQIEKENSELLASIASQLGINSRTVRWSDDFCKEVLNHRAYWGYLIDYIYQSILENKKNKGHVSSHRKKQGAYFTPYPIAYYIVKETLSEFDPSSNTKILDPAVGTGTFLSAVAHYLHDELSLPTSEITRIIHGVDKDEIAIKISSFILATELCIGFDFIHHKTAPYKAKCLDFVTADTLKRLGQKPLPFECEISANDQTCLETDFDFVVMNPPYDRLKADAESAEEKEHLRLYIDCLKKSGQYKSIDGSIDLYRLFLEKCMHVTRPNGRVGAIIPRTFLADKSAKPLRTSIINSKTLNKVLLIPEKLKTFEGVTQAFCIVILDKNASQNHIDVGCSETKFPSIKQQYDQIPYQLATNAFPDHNYIAIIDHVGYELINHLNNFPKISEIPFISNKRGELDLTLNARFLGSGSGKLLRGKHVQEYEINGNDQVDVEGFIGQIRNSTKLHDIADNRLVCQQISNNDSSKRMKFAHIGSGFVLGNSLNYINIVKGISTERWSLFAILGVLNSIILDWRFNVTSSNNHVNNYEIDDLPFPLQCNEELIGKIETLAKDLSSIESHSSELRSYLEGLVLEAYDAVGFAPYLKDHHALGAFIKV